MPEYAYLCPHGHRFSQFRSMKEPVGYAPCPECGLSSPQDWQDKAKYLTKPTIDGETSGYYGKAFPKDPKNPAKSIVPNKREWGEYCRRNNIENLS